MTMEQGRLMGPPLKLWQKAAENLRKPIDSQEKI